MKFLKTLQKRESEQPFKEESLETAADLVEVVKTSKNEPAGMLSQNDLRIGAPQTGSSVVGKVTTTKKTVQPKPRIPNPIIDERKERSSGVLKFPKVTVDVERVNSRIVAITQPLSPYCEEYRSLRTHILHKGQKRKLRTIVVVSIGPSEGKSITALNLSWLFAQTDGVRALLIDSDLRMPSLATYLGIDNRTGLSDVLTGNAALTDAIVQLDPAGLYVLPGGAARSDVAELISGPRFGEILKEAEGLFDYVIVDAPPLGIFADAAVLIDLVDGALLVVKADQTRYKDIDRVLDTLPRERMLGTVLNHSEDTLMDESYYKYGLYGSYAQAAVE